MRKLWIATLILFSSACTSMERPPADKSFLLDKPGDDDDVTKHQVIRFGTKLQVDDSVISDTNSLIKFQRNKIDFNVLLVNRPGISSPRAFFHHSVPSAIITEGLVYLLGKEPTAMSKIAVAQAGTASLTSAVVAPKAINMAVEVKSNVLTRVYRFKQNDPNQIITVWARCGTGACGTPTILNSYSYVDITGAVGSVPSIGSVVLEPDFDQDAKDTIALLQIECPKSNLIGP